MHTFRKKEFKINNKNIHTNIKTHFLHCFALLNVYLLSVNKMYINNFKYLINNLY